MIHYWKVLWPTSLRWSSVSARLTDSIVNNRISGVFQIFITGTIKTAFQNGNQENLSPRIVRLVFKELASLKNDPIEGVKVKVNEDDVSEIHATMDGPRES